MARVLHAMQEPLMARLKSVPVVEITLTDFCKADGGRILTRDEVPAPPQDAVRHGDVIDAEVDGVHQRWRYGPDGPDGLVRYVVYGEPRPGGHGDDDRKIAAVWEA
jgi:hypothetical protein